MRTTAEKTILIVDDEAPVRRLVRRVLRDLCPRSKVEESSTVSQARRKALESPPDLIVLDLQMPGENGTELCRFLQGHPRFYKTRILVITGHPNRQTRERVFSQGVYEFLQKPFDLPEFTECLGRLLR